MAVALIERAARNSSGRIRRLTTARYCNRISPKAFALRDTLGQETLVVKSDGTRIEKTYVRRGGSDQNGGVAVVE